MSGYDSSQDDPLDEDEALERELRDEDRHNEDLRERGLGRDGLPLPEGAPAPGKTLFWDEAHVLAHRAWRTKFPAGYLAPDDAFVMPIRESINALRAQLAAERERAGRTRNELAMVYGRIDAYIKRAEKAESSERELRALFVSFISDIQSGRPQATNELDHIGKWERITGLDFIEARAAWRKDGQEEEEK